MYVCMYANPSAWPGCDTRPVVPVEFIRFEFSFPSPKLVAESRLKKSSLLYY